MKTMRKGNDEIYQLDKDQTLVKKLKNQITNADEACRSSEISVNLIMSIVFLQTYFCYILASFLMLCCILDVYLSFLFVCTESLTSVSDPTSRRFIRDVYICIIKPLFVLKLYIAQCYFFSDLYILRHNRQLTFLHKHLLYCSSYHFTMLYKKKVIHEVN